MAVIEPLQALHYDLRETGGLQDVIAPPYDVIDERQREALEARSSYNAVHIDLPRDGGDPYAHAAELLDSWIREGILVPDAQPALWALSQDYTGPDGQARTRRGYPVIPVRSREWRPSHGGQNGGHGGTRTPTIS
jgi:hypothetical protein